MNANASINVTCEARALCLCGCYRIEFLTSPKGRNTRKMKKEHFDFLESSQACITIFGVEMTRFEEMKFSKSRNNGNTPAFNTLTDNQRTHITSEWLKKERLMPGR